MLKHETDERQSLWFQRQAWRWEPKESVLQGRFGADLTILHPGSSCQVASSRVSLVR